MRLSDYTLDVSSADWPHLLREWAWIFPGSKFTVWFANRFGDVFIVLNDGRVQCLDLGNGAVEDLAESRSAFADALEDEANFRDWLLAPLVDALCQGGFALAPEQCYSFKILPILGGEYAPSNVAVMSIREYFSFTASVHKQLVGLPDGTKVSFKIAD